MSTAGATLQRVPPQWIMVWAALLGALCLWGAVAAATGGPWLGLRLAPTPGGLRVVEVAAEGPSAGRIPADAILVALRDSRGERLPLDGELLLDDPDILPTYAEYNAFFERQRGLVSALEAGPVSLVLADGRNVSVTPASERPLPRLRGEFWALAIFSVIMFQVGVAIWAFRRGEITTLLVMTSSFGYMLAGVAIAPYSTRELVMAPDLFRLLNALNHLGYQTYGYAALVMLWYYPQPLGRFPMARLFLAAVACIWLNERLQIIEWPLHTFFLQYFFPFAFGTWASWRQWQRTRQRPDDRAVLLWFMLSVLVSIGVVMLLYFLPPLLGAEPVIPFWLGHFFILFLYVGLVLGVLRFRLFELERWWFAAWLWFLGGVVVVLADFILMYLLHLHPVGALSLSLILVGWVYFPARQWLWSRFVRSPSERLENYLPLLLETFFVASNPQEFQRRWEELLRRIFDPLHLRKVNGACMAPALDENGLVLTVPAIVPGDCLRLSGRSRGNRLFTQEDVRTASFILALAQRSVGLRAAQERGATVERERIARDLHDDVAPQLLTLIHRAETAATGEAARAALRTLRESIYALNDPGDVPLAQVLADWRRETVDRLEAAGGVRMTWQQPEQVDGAWLTSRQRLNLTRVLREGLTNALRHACPTRVAVVVEVEGRQLAMRLTHDGCTEAPEAWRAGNGLANMRTRVSELGGAIAWHHARSAAATLEVEWSIPLEAAMVLPAT